MSQIFLSYRRSDSEYAAGRIADRLAKALGHEAVFRDVDSIEFGEDFEVRVKTILDNCAVMLVIIGDEWLPVQDKDGKRRIDNPDDLVRREVVGAMDNEDTRVIPVLIGNAVMPTEDQLPDNLKPLAKRNAATVRADADFDHQMKELIKVILDRAPELSPTRRYGKRGGMAAAAVLALLLAYLAYEEFRPPADLTKISWNAQNFSVRTLEFGGTGYQAVYLRTGGEESAALTEDQSGKYELDIVVTDQDGGSAEGLISVTQIEHDLLPADHAGREENAIFLKMVGGNSQGEAQVSVRYENRINGETIVSNPEFRGVEVIATRELERLAREAIQELKDQRNVPSNTDANVWRVANNLLEDLDGSSFANVFEDAQTAELETIRTNARAAADQYARADGMAANAVSLDVRDAAWESYLAYVETLGRSGTDQIATAQAQRDAISEFRNGTMESVEYRACGSVSEERNCVSEKSCFPTGDRITSWSKMKVVPAEATIWHELVQLNNEDTTDDDVVVDKDDTTVTTSGGYRSWKTLDAQATGRHQIRVRQGDLVVVSKDLTVGDCN